MSTIPKKKADAIETRLMLKLNGKGILLTIHESPRSTLLYMGGRHLHCISAQIIKPNAPIGNLMTVDFNTQCSIENDFQRGIDTKALTRLMLSYISHNYPFVKDMKFDDVSTRSCGDSDQYVFLSEMSYITTGQTWYQRNFSAYLDPVSLSEFQEADQQFQTLKQTLSWSTLIDRYILQESPFQMLYETENTWQDFFRALRGQMGVEEFCDFIAPWLHSFLQDTMRFQFVHRKYFMPVTSVNGIEYTMSPYTRGGRSTRRRRFMRLRRDI